MPSAQNCGLCEQNHFERASGTPALFGICDHQDASSEGQKHESHMVPRPHTAQQIAALLQQFEWKCHEHPPYSPDFGKVSFIYLAL
jgi:hypothetical protein